MIRVFSALSRVRFLKRISTRVRPIAANGALFVGAVACSLVFAELAARYLEPAPVKSSLEYRIRAGWASFRSLSTMTFENEDGVVVEISTDEFGMRNRPGSLKNAEVIVLGDSFVAADNTVENETLVGELRALGINAYNAGMDGAGNFQQANFLKQTIHHASNLKLVVAMVYLGNDLRDNWFGGPVDAPPWNGGLDKDEVAAGPTGLGCHRFALCRWLWRQAVPAKTSMPALANYAIGEMAFLRLKPDDAASLAVAHTNQALMNIRDAAAARGIGILVVGLPSKAQMMGSFREISGFDRSKENPVYARDLKRDGFAWERPDAIIREICRQLGVTYLSLLPAFREKPFPPPFYDFDSHWRAEGQRRAAAVIAPELFVLLGK